MAQKFNLPNYQLGHSARELAMRLKDDISVKEANAIDWIVTWLDMNDSTLDALEVLLTPMLGEDNASNFARELSRISVSLKYDN